MQKLTLTVQLPSHVTYGSWLANDWARLLELARTAEGAGVDRVAVVDHVIMGSDLTQYVWANVSFPLEAAWLEPFTLLSWVASATTSLRLSTRILIAPLRPAPLLAKMAATLDVLSGGRLDLGVGTGWQREEYDAQGLDFARRGELLSDTISACRALWAGLPASYSSPLSQFSDVYCSPLPIQDRLPVWFGGTLHRKNLERIVGMGDGWIPIMGADVHTIRTGVAALAAGAPGRRFHVQGELPIRHDSGGRVDLGRTLDAVPGFVDAGANDIFLSLASLCPDPDDSTRGLAELGERFERLRASVGNIDPGDH